MFIKSLIKNKAFTQLELEAIIAKAKKSDRALELIARSAEKQLEWNDYQKLFVTEARIQQGIEFWKRNKDTLSNVELVFGVPAHIVVAILGVETAYGLQNGSCGVLDALVTLSFDYPPRSEFFKKELIAFLKMIKSYKLQNPDKLKGSYAGAMGMPQLMPSDFDTYAIDYSGQGQPDIWGSEADAISTVAYYLQKNGWQQGLPVAVGVAGNEERIDQALTTGFKPDKTVNDCFRQGLRPVASIPLAAKRVSVMKLDGINGAEYWLGFQNFYVITRYNHSRLYAMAVHQLAGAVKSGYKLTDTRVKIFAQETGKT